MRTSREPDPEQERGDDDAVCERELAIGTSQKQRSGECAVNGNGSRTLEG